MTVAYRKTLIVIQLKVQILNQDKNKNKSVLEQCTNG